MTKLELGNNLTGVVTESGRVRVNAADAPASEETVTSVDWGSDFDLAQDDATDIAPALNLLMETRQAAGIRVTKYRPDPSLPDPIIASSLKVPSGHTFDRSDARFQRKKKGRIGSFGSLTELPETGKYRLAQAITAGDTTIYLRVPAGGSLTALQTAAAASLDMIIRGENDAAGLTTDETRETAGFTIVDDSDDQNIEILLSAPAINSYEIKYPLSDWPGEDNSGDFTLVSVTVGSLLTVAAVRDQNSVTLAAIPSGLVAGSSVMLRSDELVPSGTSTLPYGEERHRVRDIVGLEVFFERQLSRDFSLAENPKLLLVDAVEGSRVICGHQPDVVIEAADASPASRVDHYVFDYADDCELVDPWVDDRFTTHSFRGASVMVRRSYNCRATGARCFRPDVNGPGDRNQLGSFYSGGTSFEGFYLVGGRHGCIAQGGHSPSWRDGYAVGCNTNALDTHGCGTIGATFDNIQCLASTATSLDSNNSRGATVGNTSHRAQDFDTVLRNCTFVGYRAGDGTGVTIRAPATRTSVIGCQFVNCDTGIMARIDDRAGAISINVVTLQANVFANCGTDIDDTVDEAPTWTTGEAITATAARPRYRINDSKLYSASADGTTGATAPTHSSGTVSDGGVAWTYVASSADRITNFVDRDTTGGGGTGNITTDDNSAIVNNIIVSADTSGKKVTSSGTSLNDVMTFTWYENSTASKEFLGVTNNERLIYVDASGDLIELELGSNLSISGGILNATGGAGSASWGGIGGTLSDQTDLQNALDAKVDETAALQGTGGISVTGSWAVDYTIQLASIAQGRVLGRAATAGAGTPVALTGAQIREIANVGDGADVVGPGGATAGNIPLLDATGKVLTDSGFAPSDFGSIDTPSFFVDGAGPDLIAGAIRAPSGAILYVSTAVKEDFEANATAGELTEAEGWLILEDPTLNAGGGGGGLSAYYLGQATSESAADPVATNLPLTGGNLPAGVSVEVGDTILITYGGRRAGGIGSPNVLTASDGVTVGSFSLVANHLYVGPSNASRASIATAVVTAATTGDWTLTLGRDASDGWQQGMQVWLLKGGVTVVDTDTIDAEGATIAPEVTTAGASGDILFNAVSVISGGVAGTITEPAGITASPSVITLESSNGFRHASGYRDDDWNVAQSWSIPDDTASSATAVAAIFRAA